MKYIILLLLGGQAACTKDSKDRLYDAIMGHTIYVPIPITNQKDSCIYMCQSFKFCSNTNIY